MFKTINKNETAEIVEKKSKFIANIFYVESIEDAENIVKSIKKKYFDARHNCYAYSIYTKEGIINRFSDDGEPSGTAGAPMLNILTGKELSNVLVIVTRYFGGILLGTGGLVRAYTGAVQEALTKIEEVKKDLGIEVILETTYPDFEKAKYYLNQNEIKIVNTDYNESIEIYFETPREKYEALKQKKEKFELNFEVKSLQIIEERYIEII